MLDSPTLPEGWRFLKSEEDPQDGDLVWDDDRGWVPASPAASPKKQTVIRKRASVNTDDWWY